MPTSLSFIEASEATAGSGTIAGVPASRKPAAMAAEVRTKSLLEVVAEGEMVGVGSI